MKHGRLDKARCHQGKDHGDPDRHTDHDAKSPQLASTMGVDTCWVHPRCMHVSSQFMRRICDRCALGHVWSWLEET
jgi:hypothetical protein